MPRGAVAPRLISINHRRVVDPAMDIRALVEDAITSLGVAEQRIFGGHRAAALNEIGRATHRLEEVRGLALDLAGMAERHPDGDPTAAAVVAA